MLKRGGFGKILLTSLLIGCEFPLAPGELYLACPFPMPADTTMYTITNKEQYLSLCHRKYDGFRDLINACVSLWNDKNKDQLLGSQVQIITYDYSKCHPATNFWNLPQNPGPVLFPPQFPRWP